MYLAVLAVLAGLASAALKPFVAREALGKVEQLSNTTGVGKLAYFDQLISHSNPSLGTFKQRYWWNADHYGGPHSPISLESPSEAAVFSGPDGSLSGVNNSTLPGLLAQDNHGAYIVIEHRYFGESTPVSGRLDAENAQHLTLDNSVQDLVYFARNVVLPFDRTNGTATKPDQAPWLLSGCSYSGALSAWTHDLAPGTFWAHEAGSAVVEALEQFWDYFEPIKNATPKNCTADFQRIVKYVDGVLQKGNETAKNALKDKLSFSGYSDKKFAAYLPNWLTVQQSHQVSDKSNPLHEFCDYIENQRPVATAPLPGPDGVGLELALDGFARLLNRLYGATNNPITVDGLSFKLQSASDADSSGPDPWSWFLCNEPFEWWQSWSRFDTTGFLSRLWSWKDDIADTCDGGFPDKNGFQYGLKSGRTYHTVNKHTGGWRNVNTSRLFWVNGEFDPWRGATVSAYRRPGGELQSTADAPVYVIPGAGHCNDYFSANGDTPEGKDTFVALRDTFRKWVGEFYEQHPNLE
ncbi:hypothetical protein G3M48_001745 [Beauveria asiatica]|uniref:Serine peptidase n=1 Tax=Beauveria asiatica TaxID=1069075 RepID=A0AAW0RZD9_9HYPO